MMARAVSSAARAAGRQIAALLRRGLGVRSPLAIFVFISALTGISFAFFFVDDVALMRAEDATVRTLAVARSVLLLVIAGCSLYFLVGRSPSGFRLGLATKTVALVLHMAGGPYPAGAEVALIGPLLLEIAIYEAYFLNLLLSLAVTALSLVVRAIPLPGGSLGGVLPAIPYFLFLTAFSVVACLLVHYREKCADQRERIEQLDGAVAKLTETNLGYQNYASEASSRSQKEERLRITRELHDTIGYTFTNIIMMLEAAVSKIHKDPQKVRQLITMARADMESGLESVRKTLYLLRAQEPLRVPTANKIGELVRVFRIATGIEVKIDFAGFPNDVEHGLESALYSFIQQALTNAFRHGAATRVEVQLIRTERSLIATVSDNGRGAEKVTEGIGIAGMRERLGKLGGEVRISAMRNKFQIIAEVPYTGEDTDGC